MEFTLKQRKNYLVITSVFFGLGFVVYGLIGSSMQKQWEITFTQNTMFIFLIYGFIGACLLFGVISGILFFIGFIKNKKVSVKIVASVFFPITIMLIIYGGVLFGVPYGIYNFYKIYKLSIKL